MLGLNGKFIPGAFERNPSASLPNSSISYADIKQQMDSLHVPQTAPANTTAAGIAYSIRNVNGLTVFSAENPRGTWNDSEIFAPPDEYLARKDLERQKAEEQKLLDNLSDEQKELLAKLERGELFGKSKLIEEN